MTHDLSRKIEIELTTSEVVVLSDCLSRLTKSPEFLHTFEPAQAQALWNLEAVIESNDPFIFSPDWDDVLKQAKSELIGENQ